MFVSAAHSRKAAARTATTTRPQRTDLARAGRALYNSPALPLAPFLSVALDSDVEGKMKHRLIRKFAFIALACVFAVTAQTVADGQGRGRGGGGGHGGGRGVGISGGSPGVDRGLGTASERSNGRSDSGLRRASDNSGGR